MSASLLRDIVKLPLSAHYIQPRKRFHIWGSRFYSLAAQAQVQPSERHAHTACPGVGPSSTRLETTPSAGNTGTKSDRPNCSTQDDQKLGKTNTPDNAGALNPDEAKHGKAKKAKTRGRGIMTCRNLLEPTKVEEHLAAIKAAKRAPVILADIERCRPRTHSHPDSPQYEVDYTTLRDNLLRSFSRKQLRTFAQLYNLDIGVTHSSCVKEDYVRSIMEEQWNWPSLSEIKQRQQSWTMSTESFPLDPRESFLILGKDGADMLSLSVRYNVDLFLSSNPLSLRVSGLQGSLNNLAKHIEDLKKGIEEVTFELPTKRRIRPDLLQRISRLAGAFTENVGKQGMVRISAKDHRSITTARRLATRAACEDEDFNMTPSLAYLPLDVPGVSLVPMSISPHSYSLYPFSLPRSLPWTMGTAGTFRIRRVCEWVGMNAGEEVSQPGGLAEGRGFILTIDGKQTELKNILLSKLPQNDSTMSKRVITASLGHILLPSPPAQRGSIIPPLKGCWDISKILKWLQTYKIKPIFAPSLPVPLLDTPPARQRILHRLVYRALPSCFEETDKNEPLSRPARFIKFEIDLSQSRLPGGHSSDESDIPMDLGNNGDTSTLSTGIDDLSKHEDGSGHLVSGATDENGEGQPLQNESVAEAAKGVNVPLAYECWSGSEAAMDLVIPDRPMDIQFSTYDSTLVPVEQWPTELKGYLIDLRSFLAYAERDAVQPDTPLILTFNDETYVLHSSASVRQSMESVSDLPADHNHDVAQSPIQMITESILDLESNQKSTLCQVTCDNIPSEDSWKSFLAQCDRLTGVTLGMGVKSGLQMIA